MAFAGEPSSSKHQTRDPSQQPEGEILEEEQQKGGVKCCFRIERRLRKEESAKQTIEGLKSGGERILNFASQVSR